MKLKSILFLILLCIAHDGFTQEDKQKKADYYFEQFFYAKAIPEYEKMLMTSKNTDYVHQKLAECHLKMGNVEKALPHLQTAVLAATPPPPDFYFMYGMALYNKGDKSGAEKWLKKYDKYGKNDIRIKTFLKNGTLASINLNEGEQYEVETVNFNSIYSDFGAFVKSNNIYFASARTNTTKEDLYGWNGEPWLDIFMLKENDLNAKPIPIPGNVNSDYHESSMVFSLNHKKETILYFTGNKYFKFKGKNYFKKRKKKDLNAKLNLKIFSAIKTGGKWIVNQDLPINSELFSTGHPFITSDGKQMYFTSDRPGGYGGSDIYYAPIHKRGGIGKPKNAGPIINTSGNEMFPFMDTEGHLFFTSNGHVGYGLLDIFSTVLNEENKIMGVTNLGSTINSPSDDFGYFEHDSGNTGYFSSNRPGGMGSDDIYKFKFTPSLMIEGTVTDFINKQPLDSVSVILYNQDNNQVLKVLVTHNNGYYKTFLNQKNKYQIEVLRKTHNQNSVLFTTPEITNSNVTIQRNIELKPILNLKLLANLNRIKFSPYRSEIRPDAALELDKVVKLMTVSYPEMVIEIAAHTTPLGSHEDNDWLSNERAKAVFDYLIEKGVPENSILSYKGYGKRKSINGCDGIDCTNKELELSARIEFPILQIRGTQNNFDASLTKTKK